MSLLLMGLPTELDHRYILESWKRFITNVAIIVNAPMKLQKVLCRWYAIFTDGYTDGMKRVNFFYALYLSVNPSVYLLPTDSSTVHKLLMRVFSMDCFLSLSPSVTHMLTDYQCKYRQKTASVNTYKKICR